MKTHALGGALSALAMLFAAPLTIATVRTESGLLDGVEQNGVMVYRGVPFAAPPVGNLRWREPQSPPAWQGVRAADHFAPACMQTEAYPPDSPPEERSEDCLYLNIRVSVSPIKGKLPVMVWIHGGGLENGSASMPLYAGDKLASLQPCSGCSGTSLRSEEIRNECIAILRMQLRGKGSQRADPMRVTPADRPARGPSLTAV